MARAAGQDERIPRRKAARLPRHARVPRLPTPEEVFPDAPTIAAGADIRTDARLRDVAGRLAAGDRSDLPAAYPAGAGRTVRGLHAAGHECFHYLLDFDEAGNRVDNRLAWWDIWERVRAGQVPEAASGPITAEPQFPEEFFLCEFSPILATVVGADVPTPGMVERGVTYTLVGWDHLPDGASPNALPGTGFVVLSRRPESVPVIREVEVEGITNVRVVRKVLVNAVEEGHSLDPTQLRPPLVIVFDVPQRAVGLEYGFLEPPGAGNAVPAHGVELVGFDRDGVELLRSLGGDPESNPAIRPNYVANRIGIRHQEGGISSVEFRFTYNPWGNPIQVPQMVYRIWAEPFPHAAVRQGMVEAIWFGPAGDNVSGEVTLPLPFRCDRAVAMLRGFNVEFVGRVGPAGGGAEELRHLDVGIEGNPVVIRTPGAEDRHGIVLRPVGLLLGEAPVSSYHVRAYYTLLAWNSAQAQVFVSRAAKSSRSAAGDVQVTLETSDACAGRPAPGGRGGPIEEFCGPVFAALQRIRIQFPGSMADELDKFQLQSAHPRRTGVTPDGVRIEWPLGLRVQSSEELDFEWHVEGVVLTGRSLRPGPKIPQDQEPPAFAFPAVGPREEGAFIWDEEDSRTAIPIRVDADRGIGFLTLTNFAFEPGGSVGQLDVEVLGTRYDGAMLDWKLGGGVSTLRLIEGGGVTRNKHFFIAWPDSCAVVPDVTFTRSRLTVQDARFEGVVDVLSLAPVQVGAIRNEGDAPILITDAAKDGDTPDAFDFRLVHARVPYALQRNAAFARLAPRDGTFSIADLARRSPLQLRPGETLLIGGRFFPRTEEAHRAFVVFSTNDPQRPRVSVGVVGVTTPSDAIGSVLPTQLNFGLVPVGTSRMRIALIQSLGQTPLILRTVRISIGLRVFDPRVGLGFALFDGETVWPPPPATSSYQLEPGGHFEARVTFRPAEARHYEAKLIFETNAGDYEVNLFGDGVQEE